MSEDDRRAAGALCVCTSTGGRAENASGLAVALQLSFHHGRPEGKQVWAESCTSRQIFYAHKVEM